MTAGPLTADQRHALGGLLDSASAVGRLPSLVAGIGREGTQVYEGLRGDHRAQYRIGSITKTFTAALIMRLRDEGLLDLADQVSAHVPDNPCAGATVRGLLSHSAGVSAEPAGDWWERTRGVSWDDLVVRNRGRAPVFAPGERYHYSNLAFAVLGQLAARLRGRSWWECVQHELLDPLGLSNTTYLPRDGAALGTSRDPRDGRLFAEPMHDAAGMAPAGQLWSTTEDLCRWIDVLVAGHRGLLDPHTALEMRTVQSGDPYEQHRGAYGLGLRLRWHPHGTYVGHTGSMPGFLAAAFADPESRSSAVVLSNATTGLEPEKLAAGLLDVIDKSQPDPPTPRAPDPLVALLEGTWHWGNTPLSLRADAGGFGLTDRGDTDHFVAAGPDVFRGVDGYFAGEELRVVRRHDGTVSHLEVVTFILTRVPYDPAAPIPGGPPAPLSSPG